MHTRIYGSNVTHRRETQNTQEESIYEGVLAILSLLKNKKPPAEVREGRKH